MIAEQAQDMSLNISNYKYGFNRLINVKLTNPYPEDQYPFARYVSLL